MQTLIVMNPASAGGRTGEHWQGIAFELEKAGVEFDLHATTGPGDATSATRSALARGVKRVVACGGDGTLNEVVNGFLDAQGNPVAPGALLGLITSGTGGDFRKTAQIPREPAAAAALLASGASRPVDAGLIEYGDGSSRCFINIADCGIGGEVVRRVNGYKRKPGRLAYAIASTGVVLTYPKVHCRVEVDDSVIEDDLVNVVVANGRFFGGGMKIAPDAELADGLFDVVLQSTGRLRALLAAGAIYRGTHLGRPGMTALRGRQVRVTPLDDNAMPFDVDGEQIGTTPATLRVLPGVLNLCAPALQNTAG